MPVLPLPPRPTAVPGLTEAERGFRFLFRGGDADLRQSRQKKKCRITMNANNVPERWKFPCMCTGPRASWRSPGTGRAPGARFARPAAPAPRRPGRLCSSTTAREASCPRHRAAHGRAAPREGQHQPGLSSPASPPRQRLHCEEQKAFKGLGSARSCRTNIVALVSN